MAVAVCAAGVLIPVTALADTGAPEVGGVCSAELADTMSLLPDGQTYVICQAAGPGYDWSAVQTPFDPHDSWLSYGQPITLHGQAMRNPNVAAGRWTAVPREPSAACRAVQRTVVEAGVLAAPDVSQGDPGHELMVKLPRSLFYLELSGDCLWTKS